MKTDAAHNPQTQKEVDPEIRAGKLFAAIGYFSFLCFVPLFLNRDNKFAQFHGRQALVLFIFELAASMLKVIPILGEVIVKVAWAGFGILSLIAVVRVLMNEYWELPLISSVARKMTL